jgi:hypothetical protein
MSLTSTKFSRICVTVMLSLFLSACSVLDREFTDHETKLLYERSSAKQNIIADYKFQDLNEITSVHFHYAHPMGSPFIASKIGALLWRSDFTKNKRVIAYV